MNFVVFISVSLIFSTIVLALPQTGAPGSFSTIDHNTPEINKLANQALDHFVSTSGSDNSSCKQKINKILSAKSQTVAGRNVDIQMEICPDNCGANASKCKICDTRIWEKSWENFSQVTKFECQQ